jgi:hypothetical protein
VLLLDYAVYIYWKQFEMVWLGLALKLGLHPVAIAGGSAPKMQEGSTQMLYTFVLYSIDVLCTIRTSWNLVLLQGTLSSIV